MKINPNGFREYDARWIFEKDIDIEGINNLGKGLGTQVIKHTKKDNPRIIVGHDYRSYSEKIKKALTGNMIGKISSLLNIKNINSFKKKLDPRLYNGAILLGLNSPVVKSHGGTDYIGFANAISVCEKIIIDPSFSWL